MTAEVPAVYRAERMRRLVLATLLVLAAGRPAAAQVRSGPAAPPEISAAGRAWFVQREPMQFAGDLYYPAGAAVFFNGNSMVRTGSFRDVPLYADTTIEPYSIVLVPIGRGMVQPYERPRQGDLAGTTGSRAPSFPVAVAAAGPARPAGPFAAMPPVPLSVPAIGGATALSAVGVTGVAGSDHAVGAAGVLSPAASPGRVATLLAPESNDGVWLRFAGQKWIHSGVAVPLSDNAFMHVGEYVGFPVYARVSLDEDVIYLPTRSGLLTPYHLRP